MENRKYNYVIVSKENRDSQSLNITSQVYKAWYSEWEKVFSSQERKFKPSADDFIRQELITLVLSEQKIVGFHFYSFFDLLRIENTFHSYFHKINPSSFESLKSKNITSIMSMEYLTVMPEFRKSESGISWGEVLITLGIRILKESPATAAFGTARRDVKVNNMGNRIGFKVLQEPIVKYDYECEVQYYPSQLNPLSSDSKTATLVTNLWDHRTDYRKINENQQKIAKAA